MNTLTRRRDLHIPAPRAVCGIDLVQLGGQIFHVEQAAGQGVRGDTAELAAQAYAVQCRVELVSVHAYTMSGVRPCTYAPRR